MHSFTNSSTWASSRYLIGGLWAKEQTKESLYAPRQPQGMICSQWRMGKQCRVFLTLMMEQQLMPVSEACEDMFRDEPICILGRAGENHHYALKMKLLSRDSMDCSLPGFCIRGIFQARVLEWVAISFSRGSSQPRDWIQVSRIVGSHFYHLSHQGRWIRPSRARQRPLASGEKQMQNPLPLQESKEKQSLNASPEQDGVPPPLGKDGLLLHETTIDIRWSSAAVGEVEAGIRRNIPWGQTQLPAKDWMEQESPTPPTRNTKQGHGHCQACSSSNCLWRRPNSRGTDLFVIQKHRNQAKHEGKMDGNTRFSGSQD